MIIGKFTLTCGIAAQVVVQHEHELTLDLRDKLVARLAPTASPAYDGTGRVYDGRCYCGECDGYGSLLGFYDEIPVKLGEIVTG